MARRCVPAEIGLELEAEDFGAVVVCCAVPVPDQEVLVPVLRTGQIDGVWILPFGLDGRGCCGGALPGEQRDEPWYPIHCSLG